MSRRRPTSNELLHAHVTRVGFDLTLGRTHIAALVYIDMSIKHDRQWHKTGRSAFSFFATAMGGLIERGLVVHHFNVKAQTENLYKMHGLKAHYTITRAGELVIELLKESGIYDEYARALPVAKSA